MLSRTPFLMCAVYGITTLTVFIYGALVVTIPQIGKSLSFTEANLQWPLNVYALANGCLLLPLGRISDIFGTKRMFMIGTAWISIWCFIIAFVQREELFILASAMLGVGAAICTPTGLSIFSQQFEPGPMKDRAIAAFGAARAFGYILGLVLGGFLCQTPLSWRGIFYIAGGLTTLFFTMGLCAIPADNMAKRYQKGFDWMGFVLSTVSIAVMIFSLVEVNNVPEGWKSPWIISLLVLSFVGIAFFIVLERQRERSGKAVTMPISPFMDKKAKLLPIVSVAFATWASWNTMEYLLTITYQQVQGLTPEATSIRMSITAVADIIFSIAVGFILPHVSLPLLLVCGLALGGTGPLLFALLKMITPSYAVAFPIQALLCFSEVVYVIANLQISLAFDADSQAVAGSVVNVAIQLGSPFGLSISTMVATSVSNIFASSHPSASTPEILEKGFRAAGWTCFAFSCLAILITVSCLWNIGTTKKIVDAEAGTLEKQTTFGVLTIISDCSVSTLEKDIPPIFDKEDFTAKDGSLTIVSDCSVSTLEEDIFDKEKTTSLTEDSSTIVSDYSVSLEDIPPIFDKEFTSITEDSSLTIVSDCSVSTSEDIPPILDKEEFTSITEGSLTIVSDCSVSTSEDIPPTLDEEFTSIAKDNNQQ